MTAPGFTFSDGGRAAAGFRGTARDCVCRAIAIASGRPYAEIYARLAEENGKQRKRYTAKKNVATAREGIHTRRKWFRDYMRELGFEWTPTMLIGSGCVVHLDAAELPPGRLVVAVSRHYCAMIDGVVFDTHDPRDRGETLYSPGHKIEDVPKGAEWLDERAGWVYRPRRCVYGYWKLAR